MEMLNLIFRIHRTSDKFELITATYDSERAQMEHLNLNLVSTWDIEYHLHTIKLHISPEAIGSDLYLVSKYHTKAKFINIVDVSTSILEANTIGRKVKEMNGAYDKVNIVCIEDNPSLLDIQVNNKMKAIREEQSLSIKFMAKLLGISVEDYSKYENMDFDELDERTSRMTLVALGCDPEDLRFTEKQMRYGRNSDEAKIEMYMNRIRNRESE